MNISNFLWVYVYLKYPLAINADKKKLINDALGDVHNDDLEYLDEHYNIIVDYVNILYPVYNSSILLEVSVIFPQDEGGTFSKKLFTFPLYFFRIIQFGLTHSVCQHFFV